MSEEFEKKVINLLETMNEKLDSLLGSGQSSASIKSEESSIKIESISTKKPSEVAKKEKEKEEVESGLIKIEGRRVCPNCGGTDFKEESDKSRVLHQQGGLKIYAKKYVCKRCGTEVR